MSLGDVTSMRAGVWERLGGTRADVVWIGLIFLLLTNYSQISPYDTITFLVLLVPKILNFSSNNMDSSASEHLCLCPTMARLFPCQGG